MARVTIESIPKISHGGKKSQWSAQQDELSELLSDAAAREVEGLVFEIDETDLDSLVSAMRKVGKDHGRKVATRFKDGTLYVKDDGEYVGRPPKAEVEAEDAAEAPQRSRRPRAAASA